MILLGALSIALAVACTPHQQPAAELEPPPEPPFEPEPPPSKPLPPPDYCEYVIIDGGEFDGHEIATVAMKKTEVTVAEYRECYRRGACSRPGRGQFATWPSLDQHPVNQVSWVQARAYCEWAGGRLPTQWEWEWAARGREAARPYPWGRRKPSCDRVAMATKNKDCGDILAVGSRPSGRSVDGLEDMAGNVWEWTSGVETGCGFMGVLEGGSAFVTNPAWFRVDYALESPANSHSPGDGIRCVRTP